jgi:hypothetical protein
MKKQGKQGPTIMDRHHYVWQHYLRAWACNGRVACLRHGNVFASNTTRLAVRRQFYRLKEISTADIEFVRELAMKTSDPFVRQANEGWIQTFTILIELKRVCVALGKAHEELSSLSEEIMSNSEEQLHTSIENSAMPYIEALRNRDLGFFSSLPDLASFLHYLSVQYMRTEKTRSSHLAALSDSPGFNAENAWGLLCHILATNISGSLFERREHLGVTILDAPKNSEFVTSDQPVVNLRAYKKPAGEETKELDLYYPISPSVALLISLIDDVGFRRQQQLSDGEVDEYNRKLAFFSAEQVFGTQEIVLERLKTLLG